MHKSLIILYSLFADASPGVLLQIEPLGERLNGAGCEFSTAENSPVVFVTESASLPNARIGVARIRLNGVRHVLDWISPEGTKPTVYAKGDLRVEATDFVDVSPACHSGECEGSLYMAKLTVRRGDRTASLEVRAHCGA